MEPVGFGTDKKFSLMEKAFYTQKHCEDYLHSGVTFIRVLGTANDYDMQIRDCIDSGLIQGPHMLCLWKMHLYDRRSWLARWN